MNGLGDMSSQYTLDSAVPPLSRAPSASTQSSDEPSDEYLMALNRMNKAKGRRAKEYYKREAERISMKG